MNQNFSEMLMVGGHANSLGKVNEVIEIVLQDKSRLEELYACMFAEDAWVRMRAADALEKICREHSDWIVPYIDRFQSELAMSTQASIQWHLAQIYEQIDLTPEQKQRAIDWLKNLLSTKEVDWIVSANVMDTLAQFTREGAFSVKEMVSLLKVQQEHKSNAVIKRANKLFAELSAE
jgi:hypothetical protein